MKPRNLQVKAGGIAAFYCAARGDPLPVIQWKKNGKRVSGQFHFWITINNLVIQGLLKPLGIYVRSIMEMMSFLRRNEKTKGRTIYINFRLINPDLIVAYI